MSSTICHLGSTSHLPEYPHKPIRTTHNMRYSFTLLGLLASTSLAAPLQRPALLQRAAWLQRRNATTNSTSNYDPPPGGDVTILNYALTLEYLERKFYQEGLANYTAKDFKAAGCKDTFYENLKTIAEDEKVCTRPPPRPSTSPYPRHPQPH